MPYLRVKNKHKWVLILCHWVWFLGMPNWSFHEIPSSFLLEKCVVENSSYDIKNVRVECNFMVTIRRHIPISLHFQRRFNICKHFAKKLFFTEYWSFWGWYYEVFKKCIPACKKNVRMYSKINQCKTLNFGSLPHCKESQHLEMVIPELFSTILVHKINSLQFTWNISYT